MVNPMTPQGAQVFERRDGGSPMMGMQTFLIASSDPTPIFDGDLVQVISQTPATGAAGQFVTQASSGVAGASYRGVFRGCKYYLSAAQQIRFSRYWPGQGVTGTSSTTGDAQAFVEIDDQLYYVIMGSSALTYGASNVGFNVGVTANASTGNTTTGFSGVSLSTAAPTTSSSLPFRIVDFLSNYSPPGSIVPGTDNSTSAQALLVQPNNWDTKNTTGY